MSLILERSSFGQVPDSNPHIGAERHPEQPHKDPGSRARRAWFGFAAVVNGMIAGLAASHGGVVDHAVEASLLVLCISIAARHDGFVRLAFVAGRWIRSYRLHQLTYHLGQLHRATAITGTVWFVVAIGVAAANGDGPGRALGLVVLAILVTMMWTARNAVRHAHHNRFEAIHRYGGWSALVILMALVVRQVARTMPSDAAIVDILGAPSVVLLLVLVALVVHPWLGVRRLACEVTGVTDDVVVLALGSDRSASTSA